jgi:iron complex outermembrane receptor protein
MGGRWGWLGAGCGLLCASAQAAALNEADFLAEIPMVLTPSRLSQTQADSPSAVTVIDRDMIRAAGITQLPDALRMVPGFVVARRDGLAPTASYPGFGDGFARRFQVLIDGRSVYSPDFGQVYWRNLPISLEDVDRIEVIRGPAAASYGANAFFGVINILTRSDEGGTRAGVMVGAGERSYRELNARVGAAGDAGHWRLSVGQREDDYYEADDFGTVADDVRDQFADGRGDWNINDTDTLSMMGGVANTRLDEDIDAGQTFPVKLQSGYGQLVWQRVHESGAETRLAYNYTQQSYGDLLDLGGLQPLDLGFSTRRQNLTAAWNGALSESIRVALGAEYRMDEVESDFYYNQAESIEENSWRVYGNGEFRLAPEWLVNAGAMLESTQASEEKVSPRLTLHYQPHPTQSFRIAYNLGYRVPTFYELYGENVLDFGFGPDTLLILPDSLESERVISREIGWWQAWPHAGVTLDMRAFYDDYTNLIDFAEVPFVDGQDDLAFQFFNAGDTTVKGLEFQFEWKPAARTRIRFAPSWVRIRADNPDWEDSAPSYAFNLLAEHGFNQNWWISGLWNRNAGFRWLGDGDAIDGANRLDLRLAWRGAASGTPIEVALIGRHLLGGEAEYVPTRETEGQQVLVQFRAGF